MQYNGNEIYATRYMKFLFLFGRRWLGYFRLYLTGVRYFCMRSMDSVSLPSCLRYALHMFTPFETDLLCIWSINWIYSRKESSRFLVKSLSGLRQNMEWISRFSCHIFRHTFASRFCENETSIKVIQEVMGHADVSTTMNIYAEANPDVTKSVIEKLSKNMDIF